MAQQRVVAIDDPTPAGEGRSQAPASATRCTAGASPPAFVANIAEIAWQEYPGHFGGALSKSLTSPQTCGSRRIDHRISCYAPMAHVAEHVHKVQEQVYHVLEGEGLLTLDDERRVLRRHDYVFVPPGVRHSFTNTGLVPLVFLVMTTPVVDEEDTL